MNRNEFYEQIKNDFFTNGTFDFEGFKSMVTSALPIFGELETEITPNEDGSKTVIFFDVDEAQVVIAPEGVSMGDIDTRMTTRALTLHLDENDVISLVEHGFGIFTPANKENVLLLASFIGKKIDFN